MNIVLWILQVLAGLMFLAAGFMKATQPLATLAVRMKWINAFPPAFVRFIGVAEVLGGIGLIVPALTGILPWLTPLAALGLLILMVGAVVVHINRREFATMPPSVVLLILTLIIMVGRFWIEPFV